MKNFNFLNKLSFTTFFCLTLFSNVANATNVDITSDNFATNTQSTNEMINSQSISTISTSSNLSYSQIDYIAESEIIRNSINELSSEISNMKTFINDSKKIYSEIEQNYNKTKSLPINEENYKRAKELKKSIVIRSIREGTLSYEDSISQYLKNEEYDKAINKLKNILKNKQEQADEYRKAYTTWQEILSLIITP